MDWVKVCKTLRHDQQPTKHHTTASLLCTNDRYREKKRRGTISEYANKFVSKLRDTILHDNFLRTHNSSALVSMIPLTHMGMLMTGDKVVTNLCSNDRDSR